jgi:K+ transporter
MTTAILYRVMLVIWRWRTAVARSVFSAFLAVDIAFFVANLTKIADGAWIPLVIGGVIFTVMTTWHAGTDAMHRIYDRDAEGVAQFLRKLRDHKIERNPGKAIYLTRPREVDRSDIIGTIRPDLPAVRELADNGRHCAADGNIRPVGPVGRCLRGGGVHHHGR